MTKAFSKQLRINPFAIDGGKTLIFFKFSNLRGEAYISFLLSSLGHMSFGGLLFKHYRQLVSSFLVLECDHEPQPRDKKNRYE
jgi:hypothetical protein